MSGDCGAVGLWSMKGMDAETRTCRDPPPPLDVAGETGEMIDVEVPTVATPLVRDALYSETSKTQNVLHHQLTPFDHGKVFATDTPLFCQQQLRFAIEGIFDLTSEYRWSG